MTQIDELLMITAGDIPYPSAQIQVHQPTAKEIGMVGETSFYQGIGLLSFDKDMINFEDKSGLEKLSNFDIIMTMIQNPSTEVQIMKADMVIVLAILFPSYTIEIKKDKIVLIDQRQEDKKETVIDSSNYDEFHDILENISCLNIGNKKKEALNPKSKLAREIAEKIKKGRTKAQKDKSQDKSSILSRYISVLAVGLQKDINILSNYTVYQLIDEYQRYTAKISFDMNIKARLAGATEIEEPKDWMGNLFEES